jgi:hypothetical protein
MFNNLINSLSSSCFVQGFKHVSYTDSHACTFLTKASYFNGRSLRFIVAIPGTIIDIVFQLFHCLTFTFEAIAIKLEILLTSKNQKNTLFASCSFTRKVLCFRQHTTSKEPWILAQDFKIDQLFPKIGRDIGIIFKLWYEVVCSILELQD